MSKSLEELLSDLKFEKYKGIRIKQKKYEPDEIEYYKYIFLDFFKSYYIDDDALFKDMLEEKFSEITEKAISGILKNIRENIIDDLDIKIYNHDQRNQHQIKFNKKVIEQAYHKYFEVKETIFFEFATLKHVTPYISISNAELSEQEIANLKPLFEEKIKNNSSFIFNHFIRHSSLKTGLVINTAPTGSGKSYNSVEYMLFYFIYKKHILKDPEYKDKKLFYMTDLLVNAMSPFKDLYKKINEFCKYYNQPKNVKDFLISKICFMASREMLMTHLVEYEKNDSEIMKIVESIADSTKDKLFQITFIMKLEKIKAMELTRRDQQDDEFISKTYAELKKYILDNIKFLNETQLIILNALFIGEHLVEGAENVADVFFLTTAKAFHGVDTKENHESILDRENCIYIIDEFDRQYGVMLDLAIEEKTDYDIYTMCRELIAIRDRNFKINESHDFDTLEKLREKFVKNKIEPFLDKFNFRNSFQSDNESGTLSVFEDHINSIILSKNKFAKFSSDVKTNTNHLEILDTSKNNYPVNTGDVNFTTLISESQMLLIDFAYFIMNCAKKYKQPKNVDIVFDITDKIRTLLEELNINKKYFLPFVKDVFYVEDIVDHRDETLNYIEKPVTVIDIKTKTESISFDAKTFTKNPNLILTKMAKNNLVFGVSATALFKTVILNFDFDYIKMYLKENLYLMTANDNLMLLNELSNDFNLVKNMVSINVSTPNNLIVNSHFFQNYSHKTNDYLKLRMLEQSNVIDHFLKDDNSRYLLMLCSAFPEEKPLEHMKKFLKEKNPNAKYRIFPESNKDKANTEFFKNTKNLKDINDYLDSDPANKVVLITHYNTVGAGMNIQVDTQNKIDSTKYVVVKENVGNKTQYDIDTLYLSKPTEIITTMRDNEKIMDNNSLIKIIIQLKALLEANQIPISKYRDLYHSLIKTQPKDVRRNIDGTHKETLDYINAVYLKIKQAIGRITRSSYRHKNVNIILSEELVGALIKQDIIEPEIYDVPEYLKFIEFLKNTKDNSTLSLNNLNENFNLNAYFKFDKTMNHLLNKIFSISNDKSKVIKQWEDIRKYCLTNGVFLNADQVNLLETIGLNNLYLKLQHPNNEYSYRVEREKDNITFFDRGIIVNEEYLKMNLIKKNERLVKHFQDNNYALNFPVSDYALLPNMINNIYKGAIGETIGQYYFKNFCHIGLDNCSDEQIASLFEVCDFFHKSMDGLVGFDMKNYNLFLNNTTHNKELISKIETKLQLGDLKRIVIVNTFLTERNFSVKYGYINNNLFVSSNSSDIRANVCIINGLLDHQGQFVNASHSIGAFIKWIR